MSYCHQPYAEVVEETCMMLNATPSSTEKSSPTHTYNTSPSDLTFEGYTMYNWLNRQQLNTYIGHNMQPFPHPSQMAMGSQYTDSSCMYDDIEAECGVYDEHGDFIENSSALESWRSDAYYDDARRSDAYYDAFGDMDCLDKEKERDFDLKFSEKENLKEKKLSGNEAFLKFLQTPPDMSHRGAAAMKRYQEAWALFLYIQQVQLRKQQQQLFTHTNDNNNNNNNNCNTSHEDNYYHQHDSNIRYHNNDNNDNNNNNNPDDNYSNWKCHMTKSDFQKFYRGRSSYYHNFSQGKNQAYHQNRRQHYNNENYVSNQYDYNSSYDNFHTRKSVGKQNQIHRNSSYYFSNDQFTSERNSRYHYKSHHNRGGRHHSGYVHAYESAYDQQGINNAEEPHLDEFEKSEGEEDKQNDLAEPMSEAE